MIPKRKKRERMNVRESSVIRCPGHLKFIRGFLCAIMNEDCRGQTEAAHIRVGTDGGTSMKPSDRYTIPLCSGHHATQHQIGEISFEAKVFAKVRKGTMLELAKQLWDVSPHGKKYRMEHPSDDGKEMPA